MTTAYVCKRCRTLAFAKDFKQLSIRYTKDELSTDNVIFIGDPYNDEHEPLYQWQTNPLSIHDLEYVDKNRTPLVVVELARRKAHTVTIPVSSDSDQHIVRDIDCTDLNIDIDTIDEFKSALQTFFTDQTYLCEKQLSKEFITFIVHIYGQLQDGNNKIALLKLLDQNNYDTSVLEATYPILYEDVERVDVVTTEPFDDIKIIINKDDVNASCNSAIYKHTPDDVKKAAVGNSTQLEAFSKNKFTVIHNKKSANIENYIPKRNHDVLDSLARNGVVCSPNTDCELSLATLMKKLRRFREFDIVFVHPSYEMKITRAEFPSELIEPSYAVNEGELMAIVYRYISIAFFGYCSVYTEEMEEFNYLI